MCLRQVLRSRGDRDSLLPMSYEPKPVDTSAVDLGQLAGLSEYLAEQTHEIWAQQRIAEGWKYGPQRDEALKQTPDLVPYSQLAESERQYDRTISAHTLKLVKLRGFQIEPPAAAALPVTAKESASTDPSDMVDDHELECLRKRIAAGESYLQPLVDRLKWLGGVLRPDYDAADAKATSRQSTYLRASLACTICAAIAVWLAIYQLAGFSLFDVPDLVLPDLEFVLVFTASLLVLLDFQNKWRDSWLANRSRAERLRSLKFRSLLDPEVWSPATQIQADAAVRGKVRELSDAETTELMGHSEDAEIDPPATAILSGVAALDQAIVNYYMRRRLQAQAAYAARNDEAHHKADSRTKLLGTVLFFLVVTFVFAHILIDFKEHSSLPKAVVAGSQQPANGDDAQKTEGETHVPPVPANVPTGASKVMIVLAAIVPAVGGALHVYRSGREAGRNHLRMRAHRKRLHGLQTQLEKPCSVAEQIRLVRQSESAMFSEHQHWLQLMKECEWYG